MASRKSLNVRKVKLCRYIQINFQGPPFIDSWAIPQILVDSGPNDGDWKETHGNTLHYMGLSDTQWNLSFWGAHPPVLQSYIVVLYSISGCIPKNIYIYKSL